MPKFERQLRLVTGLVIATYVTGHFLNHALGIVSLDTMDALRRPLAAWWRRRLRMPVWQLLEREVNYPRIVGAIWSDPWLIAKQVLLIGIGVLRVEVRGKTEQLAVLPVEDPATLLPALDRAALPG